MPVVRSVLALTNVIKKHASHLGFTLAGVTSPDPPEGFARFEAWLQDGCHGDMAYLASDRSRDRRADPRRILPACRSILVLATAYKPAHAPAVDPTEAHIAAYALGRDYHLTLLDRMQQLIARIESLAGNTIQAAAYTDTGPILERELAQRAGLGWIGRNSMLIHPEHGSHLFLSEILLDLDLQPDAAFEDDLCGSCQRCIEACPTGCIRDDRTLDARRCISYLSIEKRGCIPEEMRPAMGNHLFGCDICQDVCPWNRRFGTLTTDPAFEPQPGRLKPMLSDLLTLNPARWRAPYVESPLLRAKRAGLVRNAAIVAGNGKHADDIPSLGHALLQDPAPVARSHAAWALGQIGGNRSRHFLERAADSEEDRTVLNAIHRALLSF